MELAIVQDYLRAGGTERQSLQLLQAWKDAGVAAHLVQFRPGGALAPLADTLGLQRRVLQPLDTRLDFWSPGLIGALACPELRGVLLMGRNGNSRGAKIKKRFPEKRVVATLRTGRKLPGAYRRSLEVADAVAVNSRWAAERIRAEGLSPRRLEVIPNARTLAWADGERAALREQARRRFQLDTETRVMLQIGSMIPGKNYGELLEIVAGLDERRHPWELWCVGSGPLRRPLKQMARQLRVADRIRFPGFQEDIRPWVAGADLFVTTSLEESLPNAVIEAQLSSLPVVAYDTAGIRECLRDGVSGHLVLPGDQHAFLKQVEALLDDTRRRHEMGEAGAGQAMRFPDRAEQGRRYHELLVD